MGGDCKLYFSSKGLSIPNITIVSLCPLTESWGRIRGTSMWWCWGGRRCATSLWLSGGDCQHCLLVVASHWYIKQSCLLLQVNTKRSFKNLRKINLVAYICTNMIQQRSERECGEGGDHRISHNSFNFTYLTEMFSHGIPETYYTTGDFLKFSSILENIYWKFSRWPPSNLLCVLLFKKLYLARTCYK